jgi:hypothetical protein
MCINTAKMTATFSLYTGKVSLALGAPGEEAGQHFLRRPVATLLSRE